MQLSPRGRPGRTDALHGWTVKDLVIHLLIRERDPIGATAIMVPQLDRFAQRSANRLAEQDFSALVERVRNGPPKWSPMAIPKVDQLLNSLEYFVHHEDIRRADPGLGAARADRPRAADPVQGRGHGGQAVRPAGRRTGADPLDRRRARA